MNAREADRTTGRISSCCHFGCVLQSLFWVCSDGAHSCSRSLGVRECGGPAASRSVALHGWDVHTASRDVDVGCSTVSGGVRDGDLLEWLAPTPTLRESCAFSQWDKVATRRPDFALLTDAEVGDVRGTIRTLICFVIHTACTERVVRFDAKFGIVCCARDRWCSRR